MDGWRFPTYTLGALMAHSTSAMIAEGMDFDAVCASGDLAPIKSGQSHLDWGRAKTPGAYLGCMRRAF